MSRPDYQFDTIAAIATPPGYGGIGIIRLSGPRALEFLEPLLRPFDPRTLTPRHASLHEIHHPQTGELIDQAVITYFKAPRSFTGEDIIEISCHGSPVVLAEILRHLTELGARPADPGEFSMRAFLNGRMDLSQAEAIQDLIRAQTTYQAQLAARQHQGELSRQLQPARQRLIDLIVRFESAVEFVEDDLEALDIERLSAEIDDLSLALSRLVDSYRYGRIVRAGLRLAITGRPNVGKSSLFNALLGRDRAIVTPIPGTTRDTLSESLSIGGIPVELVDTAGIRQSSDPVEQLGVKRTQAAIVDADFVIAVIDASESSIDQDLTLIDDFPPHLIVLNKCDLGVQISPASRGLLGAKAPLISTSALTGHGIDAIKDHIHRHLTGDRATASESAIITNERHYAALQETLSALDAARRDLGAGFTEEIALANLHRALHSLGLITGETVVAELINQIFATFCIGK